MKTTMINDAGERIVIMDRSDRGPLSDEERDMLSHMDDIVDDYDDECPMMPDAMIKQMRRDINDRRKASGVTGVL